jgi:molybdopterin converting factor small subunit
MKVSVRLIGSYRKLFPPETKGSSIEVEVPQSTSVAELVSQFNVPLTDDSVIVVNGLSVDWGTLLAEGDEVSAFSAMAGG